MVEVVDLREELKAGNRGLLSGRSSRRSTALDPAAGDQAILTINRRGTASVVLCRDCGHVQTCPDCERPLVYHQAGTTLRCHHCGRATPIATRCPNCALAPDPLPRRRHAAGRGRGPAAVPGPAGRPARPRRRRARGAAERVVDAFAGGALDVLVGTSLVTKGLDIPEVTLVGVVSADVALNLPDERAAERTYQLLAQAAGRAGRGDRPGSRSSSPTSPSTAAIRAVAEATRAAFYDERARPPPPVRVAAVRAAREADRRPGRPRGRRAGGRRRWPSGSATRAAERGRDVAVLGPAPAYIARRADRWRWNLVLRGSDPVGPPRRRARAAVVRRRGSGHPPVTRCRGTLRADCAARDAWHDMTPIRATMGARTRQEDVTWTRAGPTDRIERHAAVDDPAPVAARRDVGDGSREGRRGRADGDARARPRR